MPQREQIQKTVIKIWICHVCREDIVGSDRGGTFITEDKVHLFQFHTDCLIKHLSETYIPTNIKFGW